MTLLIRLVLWVPLTLLRGWAIALLWRWFVTPLGVAALSIAHAIGISCLMLMFATITKPPDDEDEIERLCFDTSAAVIVPLLAVAVGAVAHGAMA